MKKHINYLFCLASILLITGCFKKEAYDLVKAGDFLTIIPDTIKTAADGSSASNIRVKLSAEATTSRKATLKTNLGSFEDGKGDSIDIAFYGGIEANVKLISTAVGKAKIKGIVAGLETKAAEDIEFIRAFPDKITVTVDSFSINTSYKSEVLITASLKSGSGIPSQGQQVSFSVIAESGQSIGTFLNGRNTANTDASGKAKIRFSAGSTVVTGRLTIIAEATKMDGSVISHTTYIFLTP